METKKNKITQLKRQRLEILETLHIYGSEIHCESIENKLKEIDKKLKELEDGKATKNSKVESRYKRS